MSTPQLDLILYNANVVTLDEANPTASLVACKDGRITYVGSTSELSRLKGSNTKAIDCEGQALIPGFNDAHCHVLAYASSQLAVDCRPEFFKSIEDIKNEIRQRASTTPPSQWIRAGGYNEFELLERRHPTRHDLDEASPHHPVRLNHRSGHACVLNSTALDEVGISTETPEPIDGAIDRDLNTGEPSGLLLEMNDYLDSHIPPLSDKELRDGVRIASERLTSYGVTSVQDATPQNSLERWCTFTSLKNDGLFKPRLTMMVGANSIGDFANEGLCYGSGNNQLSIGHVKIMLTLTAGTPSLTYDELLHSITKAHNIGFPAAVHAVEAEAVEMAAQAMIEARTPHLRDRIEHCSECPPPILEKLIQSGAIVVTQPGFIYHSGRRYLSEAPIEMQPWLYRVGAWNHAGVRVAFSSDAPVIEPKPIEGIYAAVTRRAKTGEVLGETERVTVEDALRMFTLRGAYSVSQEAERGSIKVGKLADFALLNSNPLWVEAEQIKDLKVTLTVIGGEVVWQA